MLLVTIPPEPAVKTTMTMGDGVLSVKNGDDWIRIPTKGEITVTLGNGVSFPMSELVDKTEK